MTRPSAPARRGVDLLGGGIPPTLVRLALPTWGTFILMNAMGIVDMFWVGRLGKEAVAAVTMGGIMMGIVIMLALGLEVGSVALVANAIGRGDRRRAGVVVAQSLLIAVILAGVVAAVCIPLAPAILRVLGGRPVVVRQGATYLRIIAAGGIAIMTQVSLSAAFRGAGDAVTPMKAIAAANVVNLALDPIFIFGWLGVPAMGVAGSAWATLIGRGVAAGLMLYWLFSSHRTAMDLHWSGFRPRWEVFGGISRIGIFAAGRALLRNIARLGMLRVAAGFGTAPVAAFGVGFRLMLLVLGPGKGFGQAAAAMVGQNLAVGQDSRAIRSGWAAAGMGFGVGAVLLVLFWIAPGMLIRVFNDDPDVVRIGGPMLRWFGASFPLLVMGIVLGDAMGGAGDSFRPMIITGVSQLGVGIGLAALLAWAWGRPEGVWAGLATGNALVGALAILVFARQKWKGAIRG